MTKYKTNYEKFQKAAHPRLVNDLSNHPVIKGYDFEKGFIPEKYFESLLTSGFQATELGKAVQIAKRMRQDNATIILSFTGNAISSGMREIITFLVKHYNP